MHDRIWLSKKWSSNLLSVIKRWSYVYPSDNIPYFLEYSPGLELNPVSNWTPVNLPIQAKSLSILSLDFNPHSIWTQVIMDHESN